MVATNWPKYFHLPLTFLRVCDVVHLFLATLSPFSASHRRKHESRKGFSCVIVEYCECFVSNREKDVVWAKFFLDDLLLPSMVFVSESIHLMKTKSGVGYVQFSVCVRTPFFLWKLALIDWKGAIKLKACHHRDVSGAHQSLSLLTLLFWWSVMWCSFLFLAKNYLRLGKKKDVLHWTRVMQVFTDH